MCDTNSRDMYVIVSRMAYLLGVDRKWFQTDTLQDNVFEFMEEVPNAGVIRSLGILRTNLLASFKEINAAILYDMGSLRNMQYIDQDAFQYLERQGFYLAEPNKKAWQYLDKANGMIRDNITQVIKKAFPLWIDHDYIRELFIMKTPTEAKARAAVKNYAYNRFRFPFQMFINMDVGTDKGNILYNDAKFVDLLYAQHGKQFTDRSKVKGASQDGVSDLVGFLDGCDGTVMLVDCENTNVFKLYSMIGWLKDNAPGCYAKIKRIELYDDIHTANAWKLLHKFTETNVTHILTERVKDDKSLVDMQLAAGACKAFYTEGVRGFLIISSDSDYFGLIHSLPDCGFLMAVEKDNVSRTTIDAMDENGVGYCYLDDFCTGSLEPLYADALKLEVRVFLQKKMSVDLSALFADAVAKARIPMQPDELESYRERYMKEIHLEKDGTSIRMTI